MNSENRIKALIKLINEANQAYYNENREIMSNYEYDELYDELCELEEKTGIILPDSPTQNVTAVVSGLKECKHEYPALSLKKTKTIDDVKAFLGDKKAVLSWKCDGLTVVVTYENGKLIKAVTRGDGFTGEDITHNAVYFKGLPQKISYKGKLIVRAEALMTYPEFERIKALIPDVEAKYKNARNLASGTCRLHDANKSKEREIWTYAFDLMYSDKHISDSFSSQLDFLEKQNFKVVERQLITKDNCEEVIREFENRIEKNEFPSDGLVLIFDDTVYGKSLGMTGKYPRNGLAFKWADETLNTTLDYVFWSASKTGLLNPVAVFKTISLMGTDVSRASVHNVSIAKKLKLGAGSEISVYKANMIIPQIAKTIKSTGDTIIPDSCPICGAPTKIIKTTNNKEEIETLYCTGADCPAKKIGKLSHFVSKQGMDIDGLSEKRLSALIDAGLIKSFSDIYSLPDKEEKVQNLHLYGNKSAKKLSENIVKSMKCDFYRFISALSIPGVGLATAKAIATHCSQNGGFESLFEIKDWTMIPDVGKTISQNIVLYIKDNKEELLKLFKILKFNEIKSGLKLKDKTFCITGKLITYKNRDELISEIEKNGGKVLSGVTFKTDYLINNDKESESSKNKKAKALGIKIISEEDFKTML